MDCSSCSTDNPASRKFCGLCGQALLQQTSGSVFTQTAAPAPPVTGTQTEFGALGSYTDGNLGFSTSMNIARRKYKALRTIANLYKALGVVVGLIFCGGAFIAFVAAVGSQSGSRDEITRVLGSFGIFGAFFSFVYGVILFIFFYGLGEFIFVFIDIEENTRITNEMLRTKMGS
jgi:hypothetical protein